MLSVFALTAVCSAVFPASVADSVRRALKLCAGSVIPSLCVFMISVKAITALGAGSFKEGKLSSFLRLSPSGIYMVLVSLASGFPNGACVGEELVRRGMDREEETCLLPFCNNASPAFLIGAVGSSAFGDPMFGLAVFAAQSAAAVICVVCGRKRRRSTYKPGSLPSKRARSGMAEAFTASVAQTAYALLCVTAFIVYFTVLSDIVSRLTDAVLPDGYVDCLLRGFAEPTGGLYKLASYGATPVSAFFAGVISGFSGISVMAQVMSQTKTDTGVYLRGKTVQAALTGALSFLIYGAVTKTSGAAEAGAFPFYLFGKSAPMLITTAEILVLFCALTGFCVCAALIFGHFGKKRRKVEKSMEKEKRIVYN